VDRKNPRYQRTSMRMVVITNCLENVDEAADICSQITSIFLCRDEPVNFRNLNFYPDVLDHILAYGTHRMSDIERINIFFSNEKTNPQKD
jgi:hypothetical protein